MTVLAISIVCPACGCDVERINGSSNGSLSVAILACTECSCQWEVTSRIVPHAASRALDSKALRAARHKATRR